ncbi:MAG: hypothetical protein DI589_25515 [Shinella sp.]|jgi:hypothetical protein|nr:MAG: hypothetical protein DI589_25515 [Shinella sp.]
MENKVTISIIDTRGNKLRGVASTIALVLAPIGIGIVAGSTAMQWAGFFFGFLTLVMIAKKLLGQNDNMTITEARALLDRLEASHD